MIGRHMMYLWRGVGWCEGIVEQRNSEKRFKIGTDQVNFWVYYHLDVRAPPLLAPSLSLLRACCFVVLARKNSILVTQHLSYKFG